MSEWYNVSLGSISTQKKGINYKSDDYVNRDTGHPFITIKCFIKGGGYDATGLKFYGGFSTNADHLNVGDVVFAVTDLTRAGDIVGSPLRVPNFGGGKSAVASMDCMQIDPIESKCDIRFLYHRMMLPDVRRQMVAFSAGSTVLHLDIKKVPQIILGLPANVEKQQTIATILDTLDQTIAKTEALIEKQQQIKAGLMHDLFTRGIGPDGKLRPPREQAPELYQETPIGWIPKEWSCTQLDVLADIIDPQPDHRTPPEQLEGVPYIGIGDFDEFGQINFQKCRKVIPKAFQKQRVRFTAKNGDIIYGKIGTIGNPRTLSDGMYAVSANVVLIQPCFDSTYLRNALESHWFEKQVSDITNTTSQPALGIEKIRVLKVPLPNDGQEVERVAKKLDAVNTKLREDSKQRAKLIKQKSGLMHDLLTGKVQVNPDPPEKASD